MAEEFAEFLKKYNNCTFAAAWENHPYPEDGFKVIDSMNPDMIVARCEDMADAIIVATALNTISKMVPNDS